MGNPAGVRRDFKELERRRLKAAKLFERGWSQADVARELGVSRESVRRWADTVEEQGSEGLRRSARVGRPSRLAAADLERLGALLEQGPEVHGFGTNLWTCERVAELIDRHFGVRFHEAHVWRVLRRMGWSCQRPVGRALERDEEAIARWKRVEWPRIKKKPLGRPELSSSSTRAGSRRGHTGSARGRHEGIRRSSSTASRGRRSRRSRE